MEKESTPRKGQTNRRRTPRLQLERLLAASSASQRAGPSRQAGGRAVFFVARFQVSKARLGRRDRSVHMQHRHIDRHLYGCGSKPMVPLWGRCTTHVGLC